MLFIPSLLKEIAGVFSAQGKQVFLVGGAVRDMLLGGKAKDFDLATDALPEEVIRIFREKNCAVIPTGVKHGTVTAHFKGEAFEITTFRTESDYHDGRRPETVRYAAAIEEDLSRRDFTMNAVALELPNGRIVDPFNGADAIKKKIIRCVGDPLERFSEDGLRPLRCARFTAQLGFSVDQNTANAIPQTLSLVEKVAFERRRDEIDKITASPKPSSGFLFMEKTGLLALLVPELAECRAIDQKGFHRFDVLDHSLLACDYTARENYPQTVRLAALFHDIGKPATRKMDESGVWTFYNHQKVSSESARNILTRYRYSNAVIEEVSHLIAEHMFQYEDCWTDSAVRRFIMRVGENHLENLYRLRYADAFGTAGIAPSADKLAPLRKRVERVLAENAALSLKDLAVSGNDLIALGVKPGPRLGIILNELLETVVDDPAQNVRERLLEIAQNIISQ